MATLHHLWDFIVFHWYEEVLAVVFALMFAVILDLLSFQSSRILTFVRYIKNRRSERSAKRLRERITQLEKQRDSYTSYLLSDKALYLANFHTAFGVLLAIAAAAALNVLNEAQPAFGIRPPFLLGPFVVLFYSLAVVLAIQGIKTASLDTREKISESITKLESEIKELEQKLQAISKLR
jgi:hypothetical protein